VKERRRRRRRRRRRKRRMSAAATTGAGTITVTKPFSKGSSLTSSPSSSTSPTYVEIFRELCHEVYWTHDAVDDDDHEFEDGVGHDEVEALNKVSW